MFSFLFCLVVYGCKLKIPIGSVVLDFILIFVKFHILFDDRVFVYIFRFSFHATIVKRNLVIFALFNEIFRFRNFAFTFANLEEKDCLFFENGFVLSIYGTVRIMVVHSNFYRWNSSSKATWLVYYLENKSIPYWILWMFLWKCSFACYE